MSLTQILGHLRTGDVIIVREGNAALRRRLAIAPRRADVVDADSFDSRNLLRNLIAARNGGGKK
ncbi:MAG: hypothetical protein K2Y71_18470 [Xanthobacteraceae bacterium]|nr:hypothetical protein [Xanthobacteraceae bacterium]